MSGRGIETNEHLPIPLRYPERPRRDSTQGLLSITQPWIPWTYCRTTFSDEDVDVQVITVSEIIENLIALQGLDRESTVAIMILSAEHGCSTTGPEFCTPDIISYYYGLNGPCGYDRTPLARVTIRSTGTILSPAYTNYVYPMSDNQTMLTRSRGTLEVCACVTNCLGVTINARVHVMFKSSRLINHHYK